jgi:hypothetical protein
MTKTMNHSNCTHPATKGARAACRKARAAHTSELAAEVESLIGSYFDGSGDAEVIMVSLAHIFPEVHEAYYNLDLDTEEVIAIARSCSL